ncbi:MAG: TonB-dependent receptor [Opitutae bacterium]|nr:TonB-dependent receptor [Opitutae bacterium]
MNTVKTFLISTALAGASTATPLQAQTDEGIVSLPDYHVLSQQVANQEPVGSIPMAISGLRFEPRVDVQSRNLAEAQADVTIRGGIFESTGFKVGAFALYDPQTGHYFAELPIAPAMLSASKVLTGTANALAGFNAGVGTVSYGWGAIDARSELALAAGDYGYNRQSYYQGGLAPAKLADLTLAGDVEWARSASDGSRPFGDQDFQRIGGRVQLRGDRTQTDLYAGYQHKFFGWPNLYTPFGFNESENLQTVLIAANHRWADGAGNRLEAGAYYRRNKDDYEFNRAVPGASNPFQHSTWVRGGAVNGWRQFDSGAVAFSAQYMRDGLRSTSLTYGPFNARSYYKFSLVPERTFALAQGSLTLRGGAAYDDSDEAKAAVSPVLAAIWQRSSQEQYYLEYAESTQLPTYTALKSSATSGLFRGNQSLGRETSRNLELGSRRKAGDWNVEAAVFHRWDDDLVDWTFRRGVTARTANPVNVRTMGFEFVASRRTRRYDVVLGYTWLHKDADYGPAAVDASFYALNFARHRLTAAVTLRLGRGLELRSDNEFRVQQENPLRTVGGDSAILSSLGLYYLPPQLRGWEFSLQVDNLWDSDYQDVPAVPAGRRQVALGVAWRW